jgi:hypothetical protein
MQKLEVGMYVRTVYNDYCNEVAIRKITEIEEETGKFWVDGFIIDTFGDEQNELSEEDISKASFDIIDLIEVGDYVNGYKVSIVNNNLNDHKGECNCVDTELWFVNEKNEFEELILFESNIKSIITHEQIDVMEYQIYE